MVTPGRLDCAVRVDCGVSTVSDVAARDCATAGGARWKSGGGATGCEARREGGVDGADGTMPLCARNWWVEKLDEDAPVL